MPDATGTGTIARESIVCVMLKPDAARRFWCVHNEDLLRSMQEAKSEEMLRERNKMNKAACIIVRCVRNYGKAVRKGMGFTLRRQGAITFPLAQPASLRVHYGCCCRCCPRSHAFEQLICEKRLAARCRVPRRRAALHNKYWLSALSNSFYLQAARQSPIEFL